MMDMDPWGWFGYGPRVYVRVVVVEAIPAAPAITADEVLNAHEALRDIDHLPEIA